MISFYNSLFSQQAFIEGVFTDWLLKQSFKKQKLITWEMRRQLLFQKHLLDTICIVFCKGAEVNNNINNSNRLTSYVHFIYVNTES